MFTVFTRIYLIIDIYFKIVGLFASFLIISKVYDIRTINDSKISIVNRYLINISMLLN
jgi:hypothetical protein